MSDTEIKPVEVIRNLGKKMRDCLKANKTSDARRLVKPWDSGFLEGKAQGFEQSAEIISRANDASERNRDKELSAVASIANELIDSQDKELEQLRRDNEELRELLKMAKCPDCDGSGIIQSYPDGEAEQCRWCFETQPFRK